MKKTHVIVWKRNRVSTNYATKHIFLFIEINANRQVINPIFLTFKYYIYNARENKKLSLQSLIACINKVRNTGNMISSKDPLQGKFFSDKWKPLLGTCRTNFWLLKRNCDKVQTI